ncbi:MAG: KH domain-containing protein [Candidatus Moraniibacteriota bacterium]|nr:MAG: KH domain-containing protein [Candidatus Moranbacteria bacterium]
MTENAKDREFVEYVVKMLVDHPDDVKVERKIDEMGVLITLDVNPEDMGMVIGREGVTAKALRTLLRVIGARNNARVNLKINEPVGSTRGNRESIPSSRNSHEERHEEVAEQSEKRSLDDVMNDIRI